MNAYEKLKKHHAKHIYTKGANKGDAPVSQRGKSHFRVIEYPDAYAVRMYNTDILMAYPDGRVIIDCEDYASRPTTQSNLNEALRKFVSPGVWMHSMRKFGYSQLVLGRVNTAGMREYYRYYNGITLDSNGTRQPQIVSELRHFNRKQLDKAQVTQFVADMQESGFKDAFKILHSVVTVDDVRMRIVSHLALRDANRADEWKWAIAKHAFRRYYNYKTNQYVNDKLTASETWSQLMRECKRDMYEIVPTEFTVV